MWKIQKIFKFCKNFKIWIFWKFEKKFFAWKFCKNFAPEKNFKFSGRPAKFSEALERENRKNGRVRDSRDRICFENFAARGVRLLFVKSFHVANIGHAANNREATTHASFKFFISIKKIFWDATNARKKSSTCFSALHSCRKYFWASKIFSSHKFWSERLQNVRDDKIFRRVMQSHKKFYRCL